MDTGPGVYGKGRYFDRNPQGGAISYQGDNIGPHARTKRDEIEIPANRLALISVADITLIRTSASSDLEKVTVELDLVVPEVGTQSFQIALLYDKLIGARIDKIVPFNVVANPGIILELYTSDLSASGTIIYVAYLVYELFDK